MTRSVRGLVSTSATSAADLVERLKAILAEVLREGDAEPWHGWAVHWLVELEESTTLESAVATLSAWAMEGLGPASFDGLSPQHERACRSLVTEIARMREGGA